MRRMETAEIGSAVVAQRNAGPAPFAKTVTGCAQAGARRRVTTRTGIARCRPGALRDTRRMVEPLG